MKSVKRGVKLLEKIVERKELDLKLSFWLPLRTNIKQHDVALIKKISIDYGQQVFNRDHLESQLAENIQRIQLPMMAKNVVPLAADESRYSSEEEDFVEESKQRAFSEDDSFMALDPLHMMERNLGNISAIHAHLQAFNRTLNLDESL